ncbi:MAG: dockerin type I repeat-containing protein, partial [Candidatus Omnitrophota bacterium]
TTDDYRAAMKVFQDNGIQVGLHTFLNCISPYSSFFNYSDPGNGLIKARIGVLKQPVTATQPKIELASLEDPDQYKQFLAMDGGSAIGPAYLLINKEIIKPGVTDGAVFDQSLRGLYRTTAQNYPAGTEVYVLARWSAGFILEPGSALAAASAQSLADFLNKANINWIYDDGSPMVRPFGMDGSTSASYVQKYGRIPLLSLLKSAVALQSGATPIINYGLNLSRKCASDDGVVFKDKEFSKRVKLYFIPTKNLNPYSDSIYEMGWWKLHGAQFGTGRYDADAVTFDDLHYVMAKVFAYRTSMGLEIGDYWDQHAAQGALFDTIGLYHQLFEQEVAGMPIPPEIYEKLRPVDMEAELNRVNGWNFVQKKVYVQEGRVDQGGLSATINNPFGDQKLKVEIRPRIDVVDYADSRNLLITDFANSSAFAWMGSAGMTCTQTAGGVLKINNSGTTAGTCTAIVSSSADLTFKRAMGLDMAGDGQKEFVTVSLGYVGMLRVFRFPLDSGARKTYVNTQPTTDSLDLAGYDTMEQPLYLSANQKQRSWGIDYAKVNPVTLTVSSGPGDYTVQFFSLKALQEKGSNSPLVNPSIEVNGQKIVFPVSLYMDDVKAHILEYNGYAKGYKLYTSNYKLLSAGTVEQDPVVLKSGANAAILNADVSVSSNLVRGDFRLTVQDDEDNDGIPTHGSFSGQYQPRTSSRLNFYDDDQPTTYDPDQNAAAGFMGDVSGDGRVTMYDAALVLKYTVGSSLTLLQQAQADINGDTKIDTVDAVAIARKALGVN